MQRLDPKLDLVFKLLLTREPELLRDMAEGILAKPVLSLDVINPGIPGELSSDKRIMNLAKQTLDELSQDPATRRLARKRSDDVKLYNIDLLASRLEGKAEGRAELVLKQLGLRFGTPSAATRARVEAAALDELDTFAERVLTASTLDEVLAPSQRRVDHRAHRP